ncbi:L-threonylcarbamoyladenylate synthase [Allobacillus sp. GCM10007491]|uniref:Threonylcarbamoyl-AMP synthase n=1 Tax=Allobacillus saliphilus TaxID=2912308 RepID=A0A941HST9_9BACI|nr:L-threonylcarbamoyladenylate synthase [Allobacillus saliphilus]MBR7554096.1 threonylcarbamoyl-AMP synthase [Allobacillus saliphilus]
MEVNHTTKQWKIDTPEDHRLNEAADWLKDGKLVAFPTETVYGLGADARNDQAVKNIFEAKGRPADNPLIVHVGDVEAVSELVTEVPEHAKKLMETFWPGPLTIILPVGNQLASDVTAGLDTVGIRIPDHEIGRALLKAANIPVAAPSANRSGRPSPTSAAHVITDLNGRIDGVVDGGITGVGVESTVIDCSMETPMILRPGGVTREQIEDVIGPVGVTGKLAASEQPRSPGMKYKHYAPDTAVWLVREARNMAVIANQLKDQGKKVGYLVSLERAHEMNLEQPFILGSRENIDEITQQLYQKLREIDEHDYDVVLAESFSKKGIGEALMNRLERAASEIK